MPADTPNRVRAHVEFLCSRQCAGREAGSLEGRAARNYIVEQLTNVTWEPTLQAVPGCRGTNVIAHKPGPGKTILVAAHYDHIGRAMGEDAYWGADDNAAAVAVVLELARRFADAPAIDLMLVAFDGEEPPHFLTDEMGSMRFTQQPPLPLDDIAVAIVLDLVGHPIGPEQAPTEIRNTLFVMGAEKTHDLTTRVNAAAQTSDGLSVQLLDLDMVPPLSDYEPFRREKVPAMFLTGGRWRHYHELTDTPDKLDYNKISATVDFVGNLVRHCAQPQLLGRYEKQRRAYATSAATIGEMARKLVPDFPQAQRIVTVIDELQPKLHDGDSISPTDYTTLLTTLLQLEQMIA